MPVCVIPSACACSFLSVTPCVIVIANSSATNKIATTHEIPKPINHGNHNHILLIWPLRLIPANSIHILNNGYHYHYNRNHHISYPLHPHLSTGITLSFVSISQSLIIFILHFSHIISLTSF